MILPDFPILRFVRIAKGLALVVVLTAQVGCGSGGGSGTVPCDGGCPPVTPADDTFLTSFCTLMEGCCVLNAAEAAPDIAGCKATVATNGFSRDPVVQSSCLSELQTLAAAGAACLPDPTNFADPCNRVYYEPNGSKQPGEACTIRADCAGTAGTITLCLGTCIQMAHGKAGDAPCLGFANSDDVIEAEPYSPTNAASPISVGVLCENRAGLYCTFTDGLAEQSCAPLGAGGDVCAISRTCASGKCAGGDQSSGAAVGTCAPIATVGQACGDDATGTVCDQTGYCTGGPGTCVPKLPAGSACTDDTNCLNDTCTGGTCAGVAGIAQLGYCTHGL